MLVICPTCRGTGKIKNPLKISETIECETCQGSPKVGWIRTEDLPKNYDRYVEDLQLKNSKSTGSMKTTL